LRRQTISLRNKLGHGINGFTFAGDCQGCLGFTVQPGIWAAKSYLPKGDISSQTANIRRLYLAD